jgi:hypothetical protein
MFTVEARDRARARLLELAESDPAVVGAAITGSYVAGRSDEWSDIDLAFAVDGPLEPALGRWADVLVHEFGALHYWDLPWASSVYRVFLLPDWLQVDIFFTPAAEFGARGPNWRTVFGETVELEASAPPARDPLIGWAWVLLRHGHACVARGKPWQAEWCISGVRDNVLALACLRLGYATRYARDADRLPAEVTAPLEAALVSSLDEAELRRALAAAGTALADELNRTDAELGARLRPLLVDQLR